MLDRIHAYMSLAGVMLLASGCACTSAGLELASPDRREAVVLHWRAADVVSGQVSASRADGRMFRGEYALTREHRRFNADLASSDGERMSCRLRLYFPSMGLRGGGDGACRFADGASIDASLPPLPRDFD